MRYRTVIELVCDASDKDDASNIAGDYLKGDLDFGVDMKCKTTSLMAHKVKKYMALGAIAFVLFAALVIKTTPFGCENNCKSGENAGRFYSSYTIMPSLKTQDEETFKKEWRKSKDEAMIRYLKK
ncbi:MAG: hypothetical protein ABH869_06865 [Candidatus Omnitrophota bacterium]